MPRTRLRICTALSTLLVLFTLVIPATNFVEAQRSALDTYAITNARIVTVSGPVIERGTIVIRNGLIAAVGENVSAPADARVIDGKGLTVYPGLIDANTSLAFPEAAPAPSPGGGGFQVAQLRPQGATASGPNSTQPAGLQPEVMAEDLIKPGGGDIDSARNAGITTALTAPRSGIWIGQSALINLAGDTAQQMIVRSPVAMHVAFTPLRTGQYPNSLMGVFAVLRQMLLDAQRYAQAQQIYERSPRGTRRPELDRSLAALVPVLEGKMPVVMYANRQREIERALDLAQEFNLHAIIAGGGEAARVANRLREHDVPVLLSLNFPKRTTAATPESEPEPLRVLRERVEAQKTAANLAAAHVRFAFQSGSMTNISDFVANAAKTIDNGLSKEDALRALTLRSAEILGVADRMGSIETGKIANLTIMRGDLFDRGSRVAHVFIDGKPVDLRPAPAAAAPGQSGSESTNAPPPAANLSGTWTISIDVGGQPLPGTMILRQQGATLSGSVTSPFGTSEFSNGVVDANGFHFSISANIQSNVVQVSVDGKATGNQIEGTMQSDLGPAHFSGTRQP